MSEPMTPTQGRGGDSLRITVPEPGTPGTPGGTKSLHRELHEVRARLESERAAAVLERREAQRLRSELSARRERERYETTGGLLVKLARLTRLLQRAPPLISQPVNV